MLKLRKFTDLQDHPIFDKRMMADHYKLYEGYVATYNQLVGAVADSDFDKANPRYSTAREVYLEQLFNHNASILHDLYFEQISGDGNAIPELQVVKDLVKRFPEWEQHLVSACLATRGWAFLTWCPFVEDFHISMADDHYRYPVGASPLIVMDLYEHAYQIQYHLNRRKYIEDTLNSLNWNVINYRYLRSRNL